MVNTGPVPQNGSYRSFEETIQTLLGLYKNDLLGERNAMIGPGDQNSPFKGGLAWHALAAEDQHLKVYFLKGSPFGHHLDF